MFKIILDNKIVYSQKIRKKHKKGLQYSANLLGKIVPLSNTHNHYSRVAFLTVIQNVKYICNIIFTFESRWKKLIQYIKSTIVIKTILYCSYIFVLKINMY